ncbi:hypothetical protein BDV11DRAFT_208358 [Aspergillus similis]
MTFNSVFVVPAWFSLWLISRLDDLPAQIFNIFHTNHRDCTRESHQELFARAFISVAEFATCNSSITIDGIIRELITEGVLPPQAQAENLNNARYFIFIILGFQTALYCPSPLDSNGRAPHLLFITEDHGCCRYTHPLLAQDINVCAHEPLSEFLMGFGVLLPSKNLCLAEEPDILRAFQQQVEIEPKTFNAYALHSLAGLKFKWTDALSCHLEFNPTTKEISLFRFPTFCHSCLEKINHFLLEIILSYRLLFGQTRKSRSLFRSRSWLAIPADLRQVWSLSQKETYYLPEDFPILRYRIVILRNCLSATVPRTLAQLWRDRRDSANWMTFWAVMIFGIFGSITAFMQVVLQFAQLLIA